MKIIFLKYIFVFACIASAFDSFTQSTITYQCILRSNAQEDTLYDGLIIPIYGIPNLLSQPAQIPSKTLYCMVGDSMVLDAKAISQYDHHTIHLHGLDVDTRNDGDPATSFWLEHMQDTTYSFKANNAGTFLYHCHVSDVVHVQMGMYGLLVVKSHNGTNYTTYPGGPIYHSYRNWLMSEVDTFWHFNVPVHDTILDTVHIPEYIPTHFLINGRGGSQLYTDDSIKVTGAENEIIYLRTANIGFNTNRIIIPSWLNPEIIDSDGRPLPSVIFNDTVYIMPGERFGVLLKPVSQGIDTIYVEYIDMNTEEVLSTSPVPVYIDGIFGITESSIVKNNFTLYPNPTSNGEFTLVNDGKINISKVDVFNSNGAMVFSKNVNIRAKEIIIPFHSRSGGTYEVKITTVDGKYTSKKLIVSK